MRGTVSYLERSASSVRVRIGEHQLHVVHQPELFLLEDGVAVQLLVDTDPAADLLDVLALKCEGHPPIYLGPRPNRGNRGPSRDLEGPLRVALGSALMEASHARKNRHSSRVGRFEKEGALALAP
jgi:hypothetical protein